MHRIFQSRASGVFCFSLSYRVPDVSNCFAIIAAALLFMCASARAVSQEPPGLLETGHIAAAGKQVPYRIHRLPVNAFPDLPDVIASALTSRGCLIPQTYGAHGPENVIHGSFERAGVADWAVLCSSHGKVSLLAFLAGGSPSEPAVLEVAAETSRLQRDEATGELGFDWGIDTATPKQIRDGEAGMTKRPSAPEHDCIADSVLDRAPTYRCLQAGKWVAFSTQ